MIDSPPWGSIFHPRSIAVVGASGNERSQGYHFVRHLLDYGYRGKIYPINPNLKEILSLRAYPGLKDVPGLVDYIICCIPASGVLDLLEECPEKKVKAIHLFTGRLGETGCRQAIELEERILRKARDLNVRIVGPNCMGIYCPRERISFDYGFPQKPGSVGLFCQSGGVTSEFVKYASQRGIHFSKVISYGNALDLDETDFLNYFSRDPETKIIVIYIEGTKDGSKFIRALREASRRKPVIVLKGGRSIAGAKAAASHTAALAGSCNIWEVALRQGGAIQARTLEEMIDIVVSFCFMPPVLGKKAGIAGGGGGKGVLAADEWEEAGFTVVPLPPEIQDKIKPRVPEAWWNWIGNPVDVSMMPGGALDTSLPGDILEMMAENSHFDLVVYNLTIDAPFRKNELIAFIRKEVEVILRLNKKTTKPLAVTLNTGAPGIGDFKDWRWQLIAEQKECLTNARIPVYNTISQAARAIGFLADYYHRIKIREGNSCEGDGLQSLPAALT